jgi:hypothetical protein
MRKFSGFLWIIFLIMLLSPGYAAANGAVSFNLVHPATVQAGRQISVDVNIVATGTDPASLCGWQYTLSYDHGLLELINVAGLGFFPISDLPGPIFDCSLAVCQNHNNPLGLLSATDLTLTTPHSTPIGSPGSGTARFIFRALATGTAEFQLISSLAPGEPFSGVANCTNFAFGQVPPEQLTNGDIIIRDYPVPAFSQNGMLVFMLLLVASAILFMRRRHNRG